MTIYAIVNQTAPVGQVKPEEFRDAADAATALAEFLAAPPPGKVPGDWLAYDTTWASYVYPTPTMHWVYDFDLVAPPPGDRMVQVDNDTLEICQMLMLDTQTAAITQDGSWQNLYRFVINPSALCPNPDRFVMRFRFQYRSTGGNPKLRLTEDGVGWGQEALLDLAGWKEDAVRIGGVPSAGMHIYVLQGDRDGATLFEIRGVVVELCAKT